MYDITFTPQAFKEYLEWHTEDKKTFKKINELIKDVQRNGLITGLGKPKPACTKLQRSLPITPSQAS